VAPGVAEGPAGDLGGAGLDPGLSVDLILSWWRAWLALAVLAFAVASACQGCWLAAVAAFAVLLAAEARLFEGAFAEARAMSREPGAGSREAPEMPG
jgi:hypothetical protein